MERDFHSNVFNKQKDFLVIFGGKKKRVLRALSFSIWNSNCFFLWKYVKEPLIWVDFIPVQNKEKFQMPGSFHERKMTLLGQNSWEHVYNSTQLYPHTEESYGSRLLLLLYRAVLTRKAMLLALCLSCLFRHSTSVLQTALWTIWVHSVLHVCDSQHQ